MVSMPSNATTLRVFAPLLVLTGVLGFLLPPGAALMSSATPYNLFHIAFGILGAAIAWGGGERASRGFNLAFGAFDLYQIAAHSLSWFPVALFRWTLADDISHLVVGLALIAVGVWGKQVRKPEE